MALGVLEALAELQGREVDATSEEEPGRIMPVVTTNHQPFSRTYNAVYGAALPRVLLVAISHSHASSTPLAVDAVVHHGLDVADYPFGSGDGGYVALLGRMTENKGVHRAIAIARAAGVPLKIAAKMREPHEREYFEKFVEPHLGDDVQYLGEVDAAGKRELLASASALLNPISWREPFGMAMLESLACGTPVVGSPQGAAPEIVEHGRGGRTHLSGVQLQGYGCARLRTDGDATGFRCLEVVA